MSRKLTILAVVAVMALMFSSVAIAKDPKVPNGPAGKSNVAHLYLFEKDPSTWQIAEGGAWGKMKYNLSGSTLNFVFNGHHLAPGGSYELIYYPDKEGNPWPRTDIICLGSNIADEFGDVHIEGSPNVGSLPNPAVDINSGAKIWLVLSNDVSCSTNIMSGWNPTEYIFEYDLITFDDTDAL